MATSDAKKKDFIRRLRLARWLVPDESRINTRIPKRCGALKKRLMNAAAIAGVDESDLVLAAVTAVCDFIEKHGEIMLPITISRRGLRARRRTGS